MKDKKCKNCGSKIGLQGERVNCPPYGITCSFKCCDELKDKKEVEKASHFTKKEIDFINKISKNAFIDGTRPVVLLAICSSIIGNAINQSNKTLTKKLSIHLVEKGIE